MAEPEFTGERVIPGQVNDDLWAEHFARYALARKLAKGRRVLDAGCGTGYGVAELALDAAEVTGLDLALEAVSHARATYPLPHVHFLAGSCTQLPFRGESVDLVTAFEVIEHLNDYRSLISECARVLAPDGIFLVSTPNRLYYAETREQVGPNPYHLHEFEAQEFAEELRSAFPLVTLLLQNRVEAFAFHRPKSFCPADARVDGGAGNPGDAHFFLAICAKEKGPEERAFVYVPKAANILREREQHVQSLQTQLRSERNRLQLELQEHRRTAQELIEKLESENQNKTEWARSTEERLTAEILAAREKLAECVRLLDERQTTIEERSRWALAESELRQRLETQLAMARASRWLRLGRKLHLGPEIEQS